MNIWNTKLHLNKKGFSLIELLIVVAIFGIISALGYPNIMKWYTKKQLQNDAHELFAVLKDAQQNSLLNKILYRISVNSDGKTISVETTDNPNCSSQSLFQDKTKVLTLKNSKLKTPGPQTFSPNGCCVDQGYTGLYVLQHINDKNNGADYGTYKINIKKATCFMDLE